MQVEANCLDDAQEQPDGAREGSGFAGQFARDGQQGQVNQWKYGIGTDFLGVDDGERRDGGEEGSDPGGGPTQPATGDCIDSRYLQEAGHCREETGAEDASARQCNPSFEQEEVKRRVNVGCPVGYDFGQAGVGQVQADPFVHPDALSVQVVEAQGEGEEQ